jgi:hypothetical protein
MGEPSFDELVSMKIHDVTPEFARELKALGLNSLNLDELVAFKIHGVEPARISEVQKLGFGPLNADQILALQIHDVTPEFLRGFKDLGFNKLTLDEALAASIHGVTPEFVKNVRKHGFNNLSMEQIIKLKQFDILPDSSKEEVLTMTHRSYIAAGVAAAGVILIAFAQESAPITGQWMIDGIGVPDQLQLTLHRSMGKSGSSTNFSSYPVNGFLGLTRAQMDSPEGVMVRFQMVRDAGTLACEGYFKRGNGAGTFTFSSDPGFIAEMRKLRYAGLDPEMLFSMAAHDVSLEYVRSLRSLKAAPTSADDLISMRIHGVSIGSSAFRLRMSW